MKLRLQPAEPPPNRQLQIEYLAPDRLRLNPFNPKRHSRRKIVALASSLRELGMNTPILVDGSLQVLSGEARLRACQELGLRQVPVIRIEHLSPEEAHLFMIAENRFAEIGAIDQTALARLFKDLSVLNLDVSLEISGYETAAIDLMIHSVDLQVGDGGEIDTPPPASTPVARIGDCFLLQDPRCGLQHRVACADALVFESYQWILNGALAKATITDPPFGGAIADYLSGQGKTKRREFIQGSAGGLTREQMTTMFASAFSNIAQASAPGALVYGFIDWRGLDVFLEQGRAHFDDLLNLIVWTKTNGGMGSFYRSQHELVCLFRANAGDHRNNVQLGVHGRNRTNVWSYPGMTSPSGRKTGEGDLLSMHPTVKPVQMIADAILDCTERSDLVLDPFLGSGTTLIAAQRTGRNFAGMDLDPLYIDCALRRWRRVTGEEPVHSGSGLTLYELEQAAESSHER